MSVPKHNILNLYFPHAWSTSIQKEKKGTLLVVYQLVIWNQDVKKHTKTNKKISWLYDHNGVAGRERVPPVALYWYCIYLIAVLCCNMCHLVTYITGNTADTGITQRWLPGDYSFSHFTHFTHNHSLNSGRNECNNWLVTSTTNQSKQLYLKGLIVLRFWGKVCCFDMLWCWGK